MKEYFSHDYNARSDLRLVKLQMKHGMAGVGAYWCIVEMLYEEDGFLPMEYERITFELRTNYDLIKSVIEDFGLFENDGEKFWSNSALERLKKRAEKSDQARQNISKRWEKYGRNTNVIQTLYKTDTIKVKESKVNNIKEELYKEEKPEKEETKIDFKKLKEFYNKNSTIGNIHDIDERRKKVLNIRAKQYGKNAIITVFEKSFKSKFLTGENNHGWKADFDWILRPENFVKILEGRYDDSEMKNNKNGTHQQLTARSAQTRQQLADAAEDLMARLTEG